MSRYIEFFAAPSDAAAAAVRNSGAAERYAVVDAGDIYFCADDAVIAWRNLLAGRAGPLVSGQDDLHMAADFVNDGSAVFALPDELVVDLIEASPVRLREVAEVWVPAVVADGTEIDVETAVVLMSGIAELARAAAGTENRLYCWVAR
ncbi:hypothetical protein [Actinoplanes regularis]|uniref:hypothetical protein n=1 Tax=Actinoplanes regularis TaxID=52697 RepID=UPI0024A22149|nr:hypothetical protein [Actinoplanes regularis]GLW30296.1 hypothetical protein Areg01_32360 [Actinoplanes regularis]